jgi:hypothetical protein
VLFIGFTRMNGYGALFHGGDKPVESLLLLHWTAAVLIDQSLPVQQAYAESNQFVR